LRGLALTEAEEWANGKRLSDEDELFLRESRELERLEANQQLAATEQANLILSEAEREARESAEESSRLLVESERKATRRVQVGSVVLGLMLLLATVAAVWATKSVNEANIKVAKTQNEAQEKLQGADLKVGMRRKRRMRLRKNRKRRNA